MKDVITREKHRNLDGFNGAIYQKTQQIDLYL